MEAWTMTTLRIGNGEYHRRWTDELYELYIDIVQRIKEQRQRWLGHVIRIDAKGVFGQIVLLFRQGVGSNQRYVEQFRFEVARRSSTGVNASTRRLNLSPSSNPAPNLRSFIYPV
ncbi:unnamed protein product [Ceratitis capitata]|uniref:(Mediterranean fruit fly) hypothetical protein n=1 Tax=Ceratitis capitata TaxID=7213 RepID=A0A811URN6_CERCA|nr:unnamed protein product [Ceratitis capitata]